MLQKYQRPRRNAYPTSDGRPMAETDAHRDIMIESIDVLQQWYRDDPNIYVSGNLLLFYEQGNKRRHVSPDVFVVKGVPDIRRDNYLMWEEGKGPDVVIEITSKTTRVEDIKKKFELYQSRLGVIEYFLFDPFGDYLEPSTQGYRQRGGEFRRIRPVDGRLPSKVLGLHLERSGSQLRLWDPSTGEWLLTSRERAEAAERDASQAKALAEKATHTAEQERSRAEQERNRAEIAEAEQARLKSELEQLRRRIEDA